MKGNRWRTELSDWKLQLGFQFVACTNCHPHEWGHSDLPAIRKPQWTLYHAEEPSTQCTESQGINCSLFKPMSFGVDFYTSMGNSDEPSCTLLIPFWINVIIWLKKKKQKKQQKKQPPCIKSLHCRLQILTRRIFLKTISGSPGSLI